MPSNPPPKKAKDSVPAIKAPVNGVSRIGTGVSGVTNNNLSVRPNNDEAQSTAGDVVTPTTTSTDLTCKEKLSPASPVTKGSPASVIAKESNPSAVQPAAAPSPINPPPSLSQNELDILDIDYDLFMDPVSPAPASSSPASSTPGLSSSFPFSSLPPPPKSVTHLPYSSFCPSSQLLSSISALSSKPSCTPSSLPPPSNNQSPPSSPTITTTTTSSSFPYPSTPTSSSDASSLASNRKRKLDDRRYTPLSAPPNFDPSAIGTTSTLFDVDAGVSLPVIVPNGSATESMVGSLMVVMRYCLVLVSIYMHATEDYIREYVVANNLPPLADVVVFMVTGRAFLFFDCVEYFEEARAHLWPFGRVDLVAAQNPLANHLFFYRVVYSCITNNTRDFLREVAGAFAALGIKVLSATFSSNLKIKNYVNIYLAGLTDYIAALSNRRAIVIAGTEGRKNTVLNPLHHRSQTSNTDVVRLYIGNLKEGMCEVKILERVRDLLVGTRFAASDVIAFFLHRAPGAKPSKYGFLQVFGKDLAEYLNSKEFSAKLLVFRISSLAEKTDSSDD